MGAAIDRERVRAATAELLAAVGEDPTRDGLRQTPDRVADAWSELFSGVGVDAASPLLADDGTVVAESTEPVVLTGIPFRSMCEHHLLPFAGSVAVAYRPRARLAGLGRLVRVVEVASSRPQIQERLTDEIAESIERGLDADAVLVVATASHACVWARGPRTPGVQAVTVRGLGAWADGSERADVLALLAAGAAAPNAGVPQPPAPGASA